jgi:hypothetical protein
MMLSLKRLSPIYIHTYVRINIKIYTYIHTYVCIYMYVCMYVYVCKYIYICLCMYIYIMIRRYVGIYIGIYPICTMCKYHRWKEGHRLDTPWPFCWSSVESVRRLPWPGSVEHLFVSCLLPSHFLVLLSCIETRDRIFFSFRENILSFNIWRWWVLCCPWTFSNVLLQNFASTIRHSKRGYVTNFIPRVGTGASFVPNTLGCWLVCEFRFFPV